MSVKTYSPKRVQLIVDNLLIQGYMDGTFISIKRSVDAMKPNVGADGEVSRTHSPNRSGEITITLKQTSDSNDDLSAIAISDDLNLNQVFPILLKDNNGNTIIDGAEAWIRKIPDSDYADDMSGREWVFDVADMGMYLGG